MCSFLKRGLQLHQKSYRIHHYSYIDMGLKGISFLECTCHSGTIKGVFRSKFCQFIVLNQKMHRLVFTKLSQWYNAPFQPGEFYSPICFNRIYACKLMKGGFLIEIETQISLLITYRQLNYFYSIKITKDKLFKQPWSSMKGSYSQ